VREVHEQTFHSHSRQARRKNAGTAGLVSSHGLQYGQRSYGGCGEEKCLLSFQIAH